MQILPRWRNVLSLKNTILQSRGIAATRTTHLASFHSTDAPFEKRKNNWNNDLGGSQRPIKNYIRYSVRQKRADAKKALNDMLFKGASSTFSAEEAFPRIGADYEEQLNKKSRLKSDKKSRMKSGSQARKAYHKKMKRISKREKLEDECYERMFCETSAKKRFTWAFKPWEIRFDWKEDLRWSNRQDQDWDSSRARGSDNESYSVGTYSERILLGLPPTGPLKIEDIKTAFHSSALKWHPDRHQGPSRAIAEEKFKLCVDAYQSLRKALSAA